MAAHGEISVQDHVTIKKRSNRIDHWVQLIVAFHQHRVESGDAALRKVSCPLHQPGQHVQNRRRVALRRGRLACCQSNFPLRHGKPRKRVGDEQDVLTQARKVHSDHRGGSECGPDAKQRRLIGCGNDHNRAAKAFLAKNLKELSHFATTLADQRQNRHVGGCSARHHPNQRALSHAASAENADTLTSCRTS